MSRAVPSSSSSSRPIAPIPHHSSQHPSHSHSAPQQPRWTPYHPSSIELHAGARNRLFLAIRSTIDEEIDWALPRLVVASFDQPEAFQLETWMDSVSVLKEWPERWLDGLEKEATVAEIRAGRLEEEFGEERSNKRQRRKLVNQALGALPEWSNDPIIETRATNSLLVLRNASFTTSNAKIICRTSFLSFLDRFFSLPIPFLLEVMLRTPEPFHHILTIVQSIFPNLSQISSPQVTRIFGEVFPRLLVETRDQAMMGNLLPLVISGMTISNLPPPPTELITHLFRQLVIRPSSGNILELTLDLLISFSLNPIHARTILSQPDFPAHLRSLVVLLEHRAQPKTRSWENDLGNPGTIYRNPAGEAVRAEFASRRRAIERDIAQRNMEVFGGRGVLSEVGDKPPAMSEMVKKKLYAMREPARSIQWMHETFVYSSTSQLLQVTFWHAYRDFFQNPSTVEALLSASEVIKNVTIAFPGASAKIWQDGMGTQKFVIAGMGFRKSSDDEDRFTCLWRGCQLPSGCKNPQQLFSHIQSAHLSSPQQPLTCNWARCNHSPFTISHLLTHLPLEVPPRVPELVISDTSVPESSLAQPLITKRPPPPLPKSIPLYILGKVTAIDHRRNPTGVPFLAALTIRNLARNLRTEINLAIPDEGREKAEEKKKHLLEERFGLPIPDNVLKEEEEEEANAARNGVDVEQGGLGEKERERAREAFVGMENRLGEVVEKNMSGLGAYLSEAFGW
ncbi:hypothetical protein CI109_100094 [Kwoniella shandongensis]|uniref:Uncharacterized protein n=1 Tax=Kwoniella shandongensis TaxID=1734106 RepID=A0A5M6BNE6_9TREE|nr:uncharacterized protein CI109_007249 [Kwoniella shandongensis]KAA5524414.1 hypothetical protein CI109_007249 [Kwoniella shandongensis]